jgi:Tol biopolymer transport system component/tRNA A-37 threonylcarbamoyl transferase component Bud32
MIGKTISHYQILEEIGRGGMGIVYKAEDTKLKRIVALKFLPPELTRDPEAKARFIREAQAASALQHHNICTIHDIDKTPEGQLFIVMDCYEGRTLKEMLVGAHPDAPDRYISMEQAISITIQIAEGLAKAHAKGIIHRDIKPANIFVTNDGEVKILDFGLAKLAGQAQLTKDSSTLGTVAYMSPEQLSGKEVDHQTDIWSLGVVLYEMLTGTLPFPGNYEQAIIYAILNEEPKTSESIPVELQGVVRRALHKNPDDRYSDGKKILAELKSLQKKTEALLKKSDFTKVKSRLLWYTSAVLLSLFLLFIIYWLTGLDTELEFRIKHTQPLTTAPGLEQDPAWSPDGTRIAYTSDESGNMDIWVRQIAAGQKVNLTKDYTGYDGKPAWSPDGEWIAFVSGRNGGGIFVIPTLGGIPRRVVSLSFAASLSNISAIPHICWSPDGMELAYAVVGHIYTVPAHGGTSTPVALPSTGLAVGYSEPAWSPDGSRIAYTDFVALGVATSQIWSAQRDGIDPVPVSEGKYFEHNPVWSSDGKELFFISDRGGSRDVWWVAVNGRGKPTSPAQSLTTGLSVGAITLSRDGTKLAYTKTMEHSNIWSIPIVSDRTLTLDNAQMLTKENNYIDLLAVSPDGEWIAFDSNRSGNQDIWIMRKDGSELRPLTTNPAHDWIGSWSPDGNQIAFHSMRCGNRDLFVMPVAGGAVTQLTSHPAEEIIPVWSPDGKKIAFVSNRKGHMDVWIMPSDGGEPKQVTFDGAQEIVNWSPDGKQIVYGSKYKPYSELFLVSAEGGEPVQLTQGRWCDIAPCFWSSDGSMIYAWGGGTPGNEGTNLWVISASDGMARSLLDLNRSLKEPVVLSSDGERIFFTLWECTGDLWMAELETINGK